MLEVVASLASCSASSKFQRPIGLTRIAEPFHARSSASAASPQGTPAIRRLTARSATPPLADDLAGFPQFRELGGDRGAIDAARIDHALRDGDSQLRIVGDLPGGSPPCLPLAWTEFGREVGDLGDCLAGTAFQRSTQGIANGAAHERADELVFSRSHRVHVISRNRIPWKSSRIFAQRRAPSRVNGEMSA